MESYRNMLDNLSKEIGLSYYSHVEMDYSSLITDEIIIKPEFYVFDIPHYKDMHLVFYDQSSVRSGSYNPFYGLYMKIPTCKNEIKMRKRFFIDVFNWSRKLKFDNSYVKRNAIIFIENNEKIPIKINSSSIRGFIDITKGIFPIDLLTIRKSRSLVPVLNGENWVRLGMSDRWEMDVKKIKYLVEKGSHFLSRLV